MIRPPMKLPFRPALPVLLLSALLPCAATATNTGVHTPQYMADYYYSKVTGVSNAFCDYYLSATDARGNTYKSPVQHVYVGAGGGSGGGGNNSGGAGH